MLLLAQPAPQTAPPPVVAAAPAQPIDPAAMAEARELLRATGFDAQLEATANRTASDTFNTILREFETRNGQPFPADLRDRFQRLVNENMGRVLADMRPTALEDSARVYARYFTAAELRELRLLQTQPVMIKLQRVAPQFMSELMQIGIAASARHMPELMTRMRAEFDAWERDQQSRRPPAG